MLDDQPQASSRVSVVVRDATRVAELIREQPSYKYVGSKAGVSAALVCEIALGRVRRVNLGTATALEQALGQRPGALFQVDPATAKALRRYLR